MKTIKKYLTKCLAGILFAILWLFSWLPLRVGYFFADCIYPILYYIVRYRRKVVRSNLTTSFPEKSEKEIITIERDFYRWFCDYLVETFKMMTISTEEMKHRMVFTGHEEINKCIENGQSVAIFLGHYCNWEWVSTLPLAVTEKALCGELYHPIENPDFNNLFLYIRQRFGSVCIPMYEALRHIIKYRNEGQPMIIGYIADQKPRWSNIHYWMPFLNHDTPMLTGTERIVKRMGQVCFYGDMTRPERGKYVCHFHLIHQHPEELEENELTTIYMKELEKSIQKEPAYWLWSHNRWNRTHEEFNRRFYEKDGRIFERDLTEQEKEA